MWRTEVPKIGGHADDQGNEPIHEPPFGRSRRRGREQETRKGQAPGQQSIRQGKSRANGQGHAEPEPRGDGTVARREINTPQNANGGDERRKSRSEQPNLMLGGREYQERAQQ